MSDIPKEILSQAAGGNIEAFEAVYNAASGFVYNVALRITNNKADAEEVAQDVFMKIYKNLRNFEFKSSFKTWAYRITVNTAINKYKSASRERNSRDQFDTAIENLASEDKTREFIDRENSEQLVSRLLDALNPDQRACIVLREIEGLSYEEISKVLKINLNTVRSRLRRARLALLTLGKNEVEANELRKN